MDLAREWMQVAPAVGQLIFKDMAVSLHQGALDFVGLLTVTHQPLSGLKEPPHGSGRAASMKT